MTDTSRARGRRRWVIPAVGALTAVALAVAVLGLTSKPSGPVDLRGNPVEAEALAPGGRVQHDPTGGEEEPEEGRFIVDSVGMDVPLRAMDAQDDLIAPPGFASAYRVRNHGVPLAAADSGTVFVVMHSLRDGGWGPGNYLIDVDGQRPVVVEGALIRVGGVDYRVTSSEVLDKTALSRTARVWADVPERLVVITCMQRPEGGPSSANVLIEAMRA